ncbi:hypothetical protein F5888DRAFT_1802761 [Russula emetica]|nr:hypothetical protein F5888DRAFT_1802761 [Russula emetica]
MSLSKNLRQTDIFLPQHDDDEIRKRLGNTWFIVHGALLQAGDSIVKERLKNESEFNADVGRGSKGERKLIALLRSMTKEEVPWRELYENEAFLKPELERRTDPSTAHATINAWNSKFKGDLAGVLFDTITDYLSKDRNPYARLTTAVNSSGTGKSRMVDQLGIEIITVPMCLRQRRREGFPPVDMELRDWLVYETGDRRSVQKRLFGFTYSLLNITRRQLETIAKEQDIPRLDEVAAKKVNKEMRTELVVKRQMRLASAFREHMTEGQTYHTSNSNRRTFYFLQFVERCEKVDDEKEYHHDRCNSGGKGLQEAGEMLCRFIDEHRVLDSEKGPRQPLVVLAFDEADTLTDNPPEPVHWNLFSELRRVLRQIRHLPIFSLFLSTAGRFNIFSPDIHSDPSAWVREPDKCSLDPISEISFDDIAYPALKNTITMDNVVNIDWISHLGRPLFGCYWDNLPQHRKSELTIMDYVKQKLLNGPTVLRNGNWTGSLACLSTRFALEFDMDGTACDVTYSQVERHMRLCTIAATTGFERMITISGSEPLLAEAAYELMKGTGTNAVCHQAGHAGLNCIDRGRRGELVAVLLVMQAYDAARVFSGRRCVSVVNFMEALLPPLK